MMKPRVSVAGLMLGLSAVGIAGLSSVLLMRGLEPEPLRWVSLSPPSISSSRMTMNTVAERRTVPRRCSNNFQLEMLSNGDEVRLPVPTRVIDGDRSIYTTELVTPLEPGFYRARLRETFFCGSGLRIEESPWVTFEVSGGAVPEN